MKIYVSLPMTGQLGTVAVRCHKAKDELRKMFKDVEIVFPLDALKIGTQEEDTTKPLSYWLGEDIKLLMECDAVYMCEGWEDSKGCNLELGCAMMYDKIVQEDIISKESDLVPIVEQILEHWNDENNTCND